LVHLYLIISQSSPMARLFQILVWSSQIVGILAVVLVAIWMSQYRGGFAWNSNPKLEFNYHPVLMVIGLIFLYAEAILIYRVFSKYPKNVLKAVHGILQASAFIFAIVALKAVLDSHNLPTPPIPNFYSLHSWFGLLTLSLFTLQLVCGFMILVWPGGSDSLRSAYMSSHIFFGLGIFCLACVTALTGIVEKTLFSKDLKYGQLPSEAYIINFLGISIVVFAAIVVFIATRGDWKRKPEPQIEREPLLSEE